MAVSLNSYLKSIGFRNHIDDGVCVSEGFIAPDGLFWMVPWGGHGDFATAVSNYYALSQGEWLYDDYRLWIKIGYTELVRPAFGREPGCVELRFYSSWPPSEDLTEEQLFTLSELSSIIDEYGFARYIGQHLKKIKIVREKKQNEQDRR